MSLRVAAGSEAGGLGQVHLDARIDPYLEPVELLEIRPLPPMSERD